MPTAGDRKELFLHARLTGDEAIKVLECDPGRAAGLVEALERECAEAGSAIGKAWRLQIAGWMAANRDDANSCRAYFDEAARISDAEGDSYCLVKSLNGLALSFINLNLFDRSLDVYRRAFQIARSLPDHPELAAMIGANIGATLHEIGDHSGAIPYLEESLEFGTGNPGNKAAIQSTLGFCLASLGRSEEGERLIADAIAICAREGFAVSEAETRGRYGSFLISLGRGRQGLEELRLAERLARENGCRSVEADALVGQGRALAAQGRRAMASRLFRKAIRLASAVDAEPILASALGAYSELQAGRRSWESAYRHLLRKERIETTVFGRQVSSQASTIKSERAEAEADALRRLYERLSTISEIGRAIASATDVMSVCRIMYERISKLMPMNALGIVLYRKETNELDYRYFISNGTEENGPVLEADPDSSFAAWCIHNGKELVIGDAMTEYKEYLPALAENWVLHGGEIRSIIYYPITVRGETIAAFTVQSRGFRQYEPYQVETLKTLAAYVGIALENARLFEELRTLATTDSLTRCMNRRHFMEVLTAEMARSRRYGTGLSVAIFDLDHFKSVNDTYGHLAGDAVLKETVETCSLLLRATDTMARYGGEEFIFCLPGTDLEGAVALAERLRTDIEASRIPAGDGREIRVTATFGVAAMQGEATPEALLDRADVALYAAKDEGRNRVGVSRGKPA